MSANGSATATTTTADGRTLAFCEWGDPDGAPVFSLHGTPGSRLSRHPDEDVYRRAHVRLITYDRAGYGRSSRHAGRNVADVVGDVAAIADALGLDRFAVYGGSGGAPHSLACGALLPERVTRCASIVGPAPLGADGLPSELWTEGMAKGNVHEFAWARAGEGTLRPQLERLTAEILSGFDSGAANPLGEDYDLAPQDLEMMSQLRGTMARSVREGIGRGVDGFVDDDLAMTKPWGFDVAAITVPVSVWYGPHDTLVPTTHGEWLSRAIPNATTVVLDGGHLSIHERLPELLAWMTVA